MKKIFASLLILLAFGLTSCNDYLEEVNPSGLTAETFYATPTGMEALVNSCYMPMRFWYGKEGGATLTELATDLFLKGGDCHHPEVADQNSSFNSQSPLLEVYWSRFYAAVNSCNTAIARLPESPLDEDTRKLRLGEVHFLRALYNWLIVETWGGVSLNTEPTDGVQTTAFRSPVEDFYALIFADLDIAIANLEGRTAHDGGRVTKPAAEAFKARMLLNRGQYAEAAALAKKVIGDYGFQLAPDFKDLWEIDNSEGATNPEVVFYVNYSANNQINTADENFDGNSVANAFRKEGGNQLHLMFTPRYDFHAGMKLDIPNSIGFQRYAATRRYLELFNSDIDQRYEGTFKEVWYANGGAVGAYTEMVQGDTAIYWSHKPLSPEFKARVALKYEARDVNDLYKPDQSLTDNRNFIEMHKHNSTTDRTAIFEFRSKRDAFVIRIAEMYLIVAEAAMQSGDLGEAVNYLNQLRTVRAKPGREADMQITAADLDLDFILEERGRELGGELFRWFDLKRTGKLIEYVRLYNTDAKDNIRDYHILRPIPQSQLDVITNAGDFPQNPGWN
jgi:tetratricopeptide (TPR) repeat protein